MAERKYTFWIESPGELLNENFTDLLNISGHSADTLAEKIDVEGLGEIYAYRVPEHALITFVSKSDQASSFRVFAREGNGKIRKYHNYHKRLKEELRKKSRQNLADTIMRASQIRNDSIKKRD